ncbi:glycosyltransferase family 4 protein [Aerosakkonemataceae cyanobacterium BLCC-F50]|uniref:Glycosyltransferase family 4 protein n=1 Tax=Floridaenema flaviceps BLCC-F50 TaxID=3153642 RepID=A0ABV4XXH5_9CYAN
MFSPIKKHIALISVHGDPAIEIGKEEAGGQNVYVRQVGQALAQKGWLVDMFTRKANPQQDKIVQHSLNCRTIRLNAGPEEFVPRDDIFVYLPEFVENFLQFQQDNQITYPIVHTNYWLSAWVGMQLKKKLDVKQVHTYHSLGAVKYKSVTTIPMIATTRLSTEKAVLETAQRIVATSPQEKEHMRNLVSQKGKIDIIPCGTDISHFGSISRIAAREQLGIDPETRVILYVGRFDRRKGIETLVRAVGQCQARKNQQLKLIIGGGFIPGHSDGKEYDRIASIVDELGLNDITIFPGRLSREVLPNYYTAADVTVVPSHYEPFGLVTIESMACGTPVIGSDVGGLQFTIVPEETGLLCPPKDNAAFAAAIDRILGNPEWRNKLGVNARERVEEMFSWDGVAAQLTNLYLDLLKQPAAKQLTTVSA